MDTNTITPTGARTKTLHWLAVGIVSAFALGFLGCSLLQPATPVAERSAPSTNMVNEPAPPAATPPDKPPRPQQPDRAPVTRVAETKHYSATPMKGAEQLVTPNPPARANADPAPHFTPAVATAAVTKD